MNLLLAIFVPPMLLVPAMGLFSSVRGDGPVVAELKRKALHVTVGLSALSFPLLLTEPVAVAAALGLVLVWMLAVRHTPSLRMRFGACLHGVKRRSAGEFCFALAIGFLLSVAESAVSYVVPLLILTFADSAAAIAGTWARHNSGARADVGKTAAGTLAFFGVAYVVTAVSLMSMTSLDGLYLTAVALSTAGLTCAVEFVSKNGTDNFSVPASAWLALTVLPGG